jgi:hypothetical protein
LEPEEPSVSPSSSSESISLSSIKDNRRILTLHDETEVEKKERIIEIDAIRETILAFIRAITGHKEIAKYFYCGGCTFFGLSLSDLQAPDACPFMISSISNYIANYIGIPDEIHLQVPGDVEGGYETIAFPLPSRLGKY